MKITKQKAALIGLAAGTLFGIGGCSSASNEAAGLYGPPPTRDQTETRTEETGQAPTEVLDPAENMEPDVYGPPQPYEEESSEAGPPEKPDGEKPPEKPDGEEPPEKPNGEEPPEKPNGEEPPEKPDGEEPPEKPNADGTLSPKDNMVPLLYGPPPISRSGGDGWKSMI